MFYIFLLLFTALQGGNVTLQTRNAQPVRVNTLQVETAHPVGGLKVMPIQHELELK